MMYTSIFTCVVNGRPLSCPVQVEDLRMRVRELEERERKESKKLADEDALRKIRVAEETIEHLQKKLAATKQVCLCIGCLGSLKSEDSCSLWHTDMLMMLTVLR
ncbi:hypothetical protein AMECASPLE_037725 [Ameca splendens]|uniref:Uncharacterized protein n=1 Tax=Ameca splendens TaxID=208324 RepID=A0ABV1A3E8_9TELE